MEKLFSGPHLKIENWTFIWINSLKFYTVDVCQVETIEIY